MLSRDLLLSVLLSIFVLLFVWSCERAHAQTIVPPPLLPPVPVKQHVNVETTGTPWYLWWSVPSAEAQIPIQESCKYLVFNLQGVSGADIAVGNSAVLVLAGYSYNCAALIFNNSANDMRCGGSNVTSTANGQVVKANTVLVLTWEVQQNWYCIQVTSAAVANVTEVRTQ